MVKDLNCRTADKKPSPQQRCSNCSDLEKNNKELEEFIGRISSQLLAAEMADMELEQIFSACADPMIVIRVDGIIVRANKQMLTLLDADSDKVVGSQSNTILTQAECDLATASCKIKQTDIELTNTNGEKLSFILTTSRLITLDGTPGTLVQYKDITERKQAEKALEAAHAALKKVAEIDGLTQIANRRTFDETLTKYWQQLLEAQQPLSAILCDIDFFKKYNDTYGHQQGDSCLISVAQALASTINANSGLTARYGGEEFIFLLPNVGHDQAVAIAEQARQNIEQLDIGHSASTIANHVTLSLGVASIIPNVNSTSKELIEAADKALYLSKGRGRNMVSHIDGNKNN